MSREWYVERTVVIEASPEQVFPLINNLKQWEQWSPWPASQTSARYDGPTEGEHATRCWTDGVHAEGGRHVDGVLTITESCADEGIQYGLRVANGRWRFASEGGISLMDVSPDDGGRTTEVTWSDAGEFGEDLLSRFRVRRMHRAMEQNVRVGLERLKRAVEGGREVSVASGSNGSSGSSVVRTPGELKCA